VSTSTTLAASGTHVLSHSEWDEIERQLFVWECDPRQLADEEIPAPSAEVIQCARQWARFSRANEAPAPFRVVPNGDGGFVFEWRLHDGKSAYTMEFLADGGVEACVFVGHKLQQREKFR